MKINKMALLVAVNVLAGHAGVFAEDLPRFGVNYMLPSNAEYRRAVREGVDIDRQTDIDMAHVRRLGLKLMRIHFFDIEASRHNGQLVDNGHLAALDRLVERCGAHGIGVILTPIAWWGRKDRKGGFSSCYTMPQMTSLPEAREAQCRYLREFAAHVNRYTGKRYADDPAVIGFECINEPIYDDKLPDAAKTAYIDALTDAIRSSGTKKPVFYNTWCNGEAAFAQSKADGASGNCYPNGGHGAERFVRGPLLGLVRHSTLGNNPLFDGRLKMVYEFDEADTLTGYMFPAIAAALRAEGVSYAAQFNYDVLAFADENWCTQSHYLNLVYTPSAAMAMAIGQEVFLRVKAGTPYKESFDRLAFDVFRLDAMKDTAEMVTETDYLYSNGALSPAPNPAALKRVWGVGDSSVVKTDGTGCHFLDRAAEGVWRLQLYPSVRMVADPFAWKMHEKKVLVLNKPVALRLALPDLGAEYAVFDANGAASVAKARGGAVTLVPGDYVLARSVTCDRAPARQLAVPAYYAPPPFMGKVLPPAWKPTGAPVNAHIEEKNFIDKRNSSCVVVIDGPEFCVITDEEMANSALGVRVRATHPETTHMEISIFDGNVYRWTVTVPISMEEKWIDVPLKDFVYRGHGAKPSPVPNLLRVRRVTLMLGRWLYPKTKDRPHGLVATGVRRTLLTNQPKKEKRDTSL